MNIRKYLNLLALLLIIIFPIFSQLDTLPIQEWDESRLAYNALELYENGGNPLVVTFDGKPEMWSTKPPLMIWLQVICMKLIGVNELALRLPAALAALATCLLLYWFFTKKFNKPLLGILVAAVLVTCGGYIRLHGTRTADYDSLLTFFITAYTLFYFLYFEERKNKYLYLCFIFVALGVLTKSVSAVLFAPAMFLYLFSNKKNFRIFLSPHLYIAIVLFLVISLGYYFLREQYNPGYIAAVIENELMGRYSNVVEAHSGAADYYIQHIIRDGIHPALLFTVPLGIVAGTTTYNKRLRRLTLLTCLILGTYILILSNAQTKIDWYDMPLFPWFALLSGVFIYSVFRRFLFVCRLHHVKYDSLSICFPVFLLLIPYIHILQNLTTLQPSNDVYLSQQRLSVFLRDAKDAKHNIDGYTVIANSYALNIRWYERAFFKGKIKRIEDWEMPANITAGMTIASGHEQTKQHIEQTYDAEFIRAYNGVNVYKIHGIRQPAVTQ